MLSSNRHRGQMKIWNRDLAASGGGCTCTLCIYVQRITMLPMGACMYMYISGKGSKFRGLEAVIRCIIQLRRRNVGVYSFDPPTERPNAAATWSRPSQTHLHFSDFIAAARFLIAATTRDRSIDDRSAIFSSDSDTDALLALPINSQSSPQHCHKSWCTVVPVFVVNAPKYTFVPTTNYQVPNYQLATTNCLLPTPHLHHYTQR